MVSIPTSTCLSLLFNLLRNRPAEIACDDLLICFAVQQRRLLGLILLSNLFKFAKEESNHLTLHA